MDVMIFIINVMILIYGLHAINKRIPEHIALFMALLLEIVHKLFKIKKAPLITRFLVRELCASHWFNISRAQHDLGYQPRIKLNEGLQLII